MEGIELRKAMEEARELVGARLAKVHQVGGAFFLRVFRPSGALAIDLGGKGFHRTALRPPAPPAPPPFCQLLRKLAGQPLIAIDQAGLDRVVRLRFPEADLVLDLRPRLGNLFYLGRDGRVASFRDGDLQPVEFMSEGDPLHGLGPELRRAAAALGHAPSDAELAVFAGDLLARPPAGYLYQTERGILVSFFPRPDLGEARFSFPTFWQALDRALEDRLATAVAKERRDQVERAIRRRKRALAALREAEREAIRWPELKAKADLILTRLSEIPPGIPEVEVDGFDGQPVRLVLDPTLPPLAYAQAQYRKAGKLRRRLEHIPNRRRALEQELARLEDLASLLATRPELVPYLEEDLAALGDPRVEPTPNKAEAPTQPREFLIDGFTVIVGRSARENDHLVRTARPDDIWLHARGVPGAHVLVRSGGRPVPEAVLRRAAELAAWHSRARGERKAEVSYTEARYLRKPKGAPAGAVTVRTENVIVVPGEKGP